MEYATNIERGKIIDIISSNSIYSTISVTDKMYRIGESEAKITVQCDENGKVLSACCKHGKNILIFKQEDALFIYNACEHRYAAQTREQQKIEQLNKRYR